MCHKGYFERRGINKYVVCKTKNNSIKNIINKYEIKRTKNILKSELKLLDIKKMNLLKYYYPLSNLLIHPITIRI